MSCSYRRISGCLTGISCEGALAGEFVWVSKSYDHLFQKSMIFGEVFWLVSNVCCNSGLDAWMDGCVIWDDSFAFEEQAPR